MSKEPEQNKTGKPREVPDDIRDLQDPAFTEDDLLAALAKVSKPKPDDPSAPGRGKART